MTYAPPKMTSEQEVFDFVVRHLHRQGIQSLGVQGCCYRGANGRMCAVGCLIADEHYKASLEGYINPAVEDAIEHSTGMRPESPLLSRLQAVHDNSDVHRWPTRLRTMALGRGLRDTVVLECWPDAEDDS